MVHIPPGHTVDWYRVPLPADVLARLNQRSDGRGLAQALGHLGLCAASGTFAVWAALGQHWWWLVAALVLHGNVCAFMINAVHELVHGTVFRTRWLNTLFVHVFAFIGWINHRLFWASHAQHHLHTMHFPYDQENVFPIRYRLRDLLREATVNPLALRGLISHHWRLARGRLHGDWERHVAADPAVQAGIAAWSRWLLLGHAVIAGVSLAHGLWIIPVVVSLTPLYAKGLFWLLNNAQHVGLCESVADFRLNCRTIIVNPLFRFLYWHMNWHIEHHMYAAVPCYRLAALHRAISHELPHCPRGLVETWWHIVGIMWRQEREPGWAFRPELPGTAVVEAKPAAPPAAPAAAGERRRVWQCSICGFVYDQALGLPAEGIAPGTAWEDVPTTWMCPDCGVAKADFAMVELTRPVVAAATAGEPVVIVGGGMAAYALARELRQLDRGVPITVLTRDAGEVYAKPALSGSCAHGRTPDGLVTRSAAELAADLGIVIRARSTVTAIDALARRVQVDGAWQAWRHLVLAVGADPIRLPLAGDAADRVLSVNDLDGYRELRRRLPAGGRIAIIGGGLIGCEFADDLRAGGHRVTVIDRAPEALSGLVPAAVGARLRAALAAGGVAWHAQATVARVEGDGPGVAVVLGDGRRLAADVVLSAVGLAPRVALARDAGLAVGRGIRVDARLATSAPGISAIGDCAEIDGRVLPFVLPLTRCARALAGTILGTPAAPDLAVLPVQVKTPSLPIIAVRADHAVGAWSIEEVAGGCIARACDGEGVLRGLVLAGAACARRDELERIGSRLQPAG